VGFNVKWKPIRRRMVIAYYLGVSSTDANDAINNGGLKLTQTGVSSFAVHNGGAFCIKSGELYWTGYVGSYLDATGTGAGTNSSNYSWTQVGSDTDWYDIVAYSTYPYQAIAIKGSSGSRYLYACGANANYGTGQGTTSGNIYSWTRVKSAAATDLTESFEKVALSYSGVLAVTEGATGGKLFSFGENGYGTLGDGTTTDKPYATQVGTDTDWTDCWIQRFGSFAMKYDGTMYMSTSRNSWNIEPSITKYFTQIGTDTDYEDIRVNSEDSGGNGYLVFAKKNGAWYLSQGTAYTDGWAGEGYKAATVSDTWVAINDYLLENTITGTIDYILPVESHLTQNTLGVMFAVS